jgi:nucleotide-binding universal stress UspA family protein
VYRHILLAIDASEACRHVADHGYELASQLGAAVTVLHVLDDVGIPFVQYGMEPYVDVEAANPKVVEAQRSAAERLVADVAEAAPSRVRAEGIVVEAAGHRLGEVISREADERDADLILMGTHGHRGLSKVFLGSVADAVIRAANVPITLVRYHDHPDD